MRSRSRKGRRLALVGVMVGLTFGTLPPSAMSAVPLSFERIHGFDAPGTPAQYNSVGVLQGRTEERQEHPGPDPGTSASAAYFEPLAKTIVSEAKGWQVWAVERRENLLEDHSMLDQAKEDRATPKQLFDYYLGWLTDSSITKHFQLIPDFDVGFARQCASRSRICGAWSRPRESTAARLW